MRLPHPNTERLCFIAEDADELIKLIGSELAPGEEALIQQYCELGLPPVTSRSALSALFGYNEGFVWSLLNRTQRHYRRFEIPKGKGSREIFAPKVGLKVIQRWLGFHFQKRWTAKDNVYGFVPGRSHLQAASRHLDCEWIVSVDIENFFPSVSHWQVNSALEGLGYRDAFSTGAIVKLTCLGMGLTQGAPSSPVLSNVVLDGLDERLSSYAVANELVYTRYADDIVVSGRSGSPDDAVKEVSNALKSDGWKIAEAKTTIHQKPHRLKVHGLLVHGSGIRLTKGYRNRIRAYKHMLGKGKVKASDVAKLSGHIEYSDQVDRFKD